MKPLIIFGTRPECIKVASTIREFETRGIDYRVVVTGQHREMLDPFIKFFKIRVDHDLAIMKPGQDLYHVTTETMTKLRDVLRDERPDVTLTQGDTSTAFASSLASFYEKIPVAHIEAGLRTNNLYDPFPEEMNRCLIDRLSTWLFPPTKGSANNLLKEGIDSTKIFTTGNTVVDALDLIMKDESFQQMALPFQPVNGNKVILVTAHRRESFGEPFENLCRAIERLASDNANVDIVYPVHLNPNVREPVNKILKGKERIHLIEPLEYLPFLRMVQRSDLILTDSGGVQEEAPSFGKPVLIMRETTERMEGVDAGIARLVGTSTDEICSVAKSFLDASSMANQIAQNPYGDGKAAERIVDVLVKELSA